MRVKLFPFREVISQYPMNTAFGIWWLVFSGLAVAQARFGKIEGSPSAIANFNIIEIYILAFLWFFSGTMILVALYLKEPRLDRYYQRRKWAYTSAIIAGGLYVFRSSQLAPLDYMAIGFGMLQLSVGFFSLISVIIIERRKRALLMGGEVNGG